MVGAIDVRNLGRQEGHLDHDELRDIDDALLLVLGLG
jgi:mRNA-degrading endonuclease toxin of MazEF toxin-antitoxin module